MVATLIGWHAGLQGGTAAEDLDLDLLALLTARPTSTEPSTGSPISTLLSSPAGVKRTRPKHHAGVSQLVFGELKLTGWESHARKPYLESAGCDC